MIDLQQYRSTIGCFYLRIQNESSIYMYFNSPCNAALHALLVLGRIVEVGEILLYGNVNIAPLVYCDVAL